MKDMYQTNSSVRINWRSENGSTLTPIAKTSEVSEDGYIIKEPELVNILQFATKRQNKKELLDYISGEFDLPKEDSTKILNSLLERGFLVRTNEIDEQPTEWFNKEWQQAYFYHCATRDVEYLESKDTRRDGIENRIQDYRNSDDPPEVYKDIVGNERINLSSDSSLPNKSLDNILEKRSTSRNFQGSISKNDLSKVLQYACNIARENRQNILNNSEEDPVIHTKSRFLPFEIYPVIFNGNDIEDGLYWYDIKEHDLVQIRSGDYLDSVIDIAIGQEWIRNAPVAFLFTSVYERYFWRYRHSDEFRNIMIDVSALAHRIILGATSMDLGSFMTPALREELAEDFLDIDTLEEGLLYLVAIGDTPNDN